MKYKSTAVRALFEAARDHLDPNSKFVIEHTYFSTEWDRKTGAVVNLPEAIKDKEIARHLNTTEGNVRVIRNRAIKKLGELVF